MDNYKKNPTTGDGGERGMKTAAMYVRMSTDHQKYSTENQEDAIREYAQRRNIEIIAIYADQGKSGLDIGGREALQRLISDVENKRAEFSVILVLDVTRWGRFQDADESAYYEYVCRRAGIDVQYVAEQFENDGSPVSTIVKGVKRAMAGEYAMIDNNDLTNPVTVLSQRKLWHKVERRTSYIRDTQVAAWYSAVLNLKNQSIKDGLRFLLFTGLRRMEAFTLRWEHVDFDKRLITIPHTKNGSSHELPLSDYLYDLLHRRKQDAGNSPWVFPGDGKAGHLTEPRAAIKKIVKESKVEFMPHDLRRTFITIAEQLNISAYSLKRLLNHKKGNDVTAGYIIIETERLRKPMQDISDKLISLLHTTQQ